MTAQRIQWSAVFAKHDVDVGQLTVDLRLVSLMDYDLAYFDSESNKLYALDSPFGPKYLECDRQKV